MYDVTDQVSSRRKLCYSDQVGSYYLINSYPFYLYGQKLNIIWAPNELVSQNVILFSLRECLVFGFTFAFRDSGYIYYQLKN